MIQMDLFADSEIEMLRQNLEDSKNTTSRCLRSIFARLRDVEEVLYAMKKTEKEKEE